MDEILAFVTLIALSLSPLPTLPLIVDIYSRFPLYSALPIVYFGIIVSACANYYFSRMLVKTRYSVVMKSRMKDRLSKRYINISKKTNGIRDRISNMSTLQLYLLLQMSIVPGKVIFASCGLLGIAAKRFIPAVMAANILSQALYWTLGESAGRLQSALVPIGIDDVFVARICAAVVVTFSVVLVRAVIRLTVSKLRARKDYRRPE